MANKIGIVLALDGEKEFSQGLKTATSAAKEAQSELKKLDSQYSGSANSMEALKAKQEALTNAQEKYTQKVSAAQSGLDHANTTLEKSKTRYSELQKEVDNARKALQDMESAGKSGTSAYTEQADKVQKLETALRDQGTECDKAQQKVYQYQTKLNGAESELNGMNQAVEQNEQYMREAESSVDGCATSIDQYGNQVQQAETVTTSWADKLKQAFANAAVTVGMRALREGIREIVKAFKEMVQVGSEFEAAMSNVSALSGATGSDLDSLSTKAQELGSSTKFTATEVADAFSYMALAGWDTQQMLDGISGVLDLAAASGMELADASDLVTDYLTAFNMEASEASTVADMLSYAQANSNTTTEQLGEAYKNCAANMNAAGQDIQTVTACLEAMANQGYKGSQAGTALKAVMRDITNYMQDGAIAIGDTTVAVQDQDGNFRDLTDILRDVESATDGMGTAEKQTALSTTFTSRSLSALNLMLNEGVDSISDYEDALRSCDGAAADMADTMQDNLQGDLTRMNSALQGLGIAVYDYINEPLRNVVQTITGALSGITEAISPQETALEGMVSSAKSATSELQGAMSNATQSIEEAAVSSERLGLLGDQLISLNNVEELTATQKERMAEIVGELSESIPELAAAFDEETGQVNLTDEAIQRLIQTQQEYQMIQAMNAAAEEEIAALAEAEVALKQAEIAQEALEEGKGFWTSLEELIEQMEAEIQVVGEENYDFGSGIAEAEALIEEAFNEGIISVDEYNEALDSIEGAESLVGVQNAAVVASANMNEYTVSAEEAADTTEKLSATVDEAQADYDQYSEAIDELTGEYEKNAEETAELVDKELAAADAAHDTSAGYERMRDEAHAAAEETTYLYDESGNLIGTLDDLKDSTVDAADAETELYDEAGNCVGTMGDFATVTDETAEAMTTLTQTAEDAATALETSYTDAFNSVMDLYNSTKESLAQGLDIDFRTEFNGGSDETVESMIETAQANIQALQDYANNLEIVKDHVGQEIAPEFLAYLESLGTDGANTLQHIANTFEQDNGSELIKQWSDEYLETLDIEDEIAATLALDQMMLENGLSDLGSTDAEWTALQDSFDQALQIAENSGQQISEAERNAFNEAVTAAQEAGVQIPDGLAEGLENGTVSVESATDQLNAAMQGKFDALEQIAEEQGIEIPSSLAEGVANGGEDAAAAIDEIMSELEASISGGEGGITSASESAIGGGVESGTSSAEGKAEEGGEQIAEGYASGVESGEGEIESSVESVADSAVEALDGKADEFEEAGRSSGEAYTDGIESVSTDSSAQNLTKSVTDALQNTSEFETAGQNAAQAYGDGLATGSGNAASQARELASAAIDVLEQTAANFANPATTAAEAYNAALANAAGTSASEARALASGAIDVLEQTASNFSNPGTTSGNNYADAIASTSGTVASQTRTISSAAIDVLNQAAGNFTAPGTSAGSNYANGISSTAGSAASAASSVASAAVSAASGYAGSFYSIGYNMSIGLANGISAGGSAAISAAISVASAALAAAQSALAIHSPSAKMRDKVGLMMSKGMAEGILAGAKEATDASADVALATLTAAQDALEISSPSKKFKNKVGKMIASGMGEGIKKNSALAVDAADAMSTQVYNAAVKWMNKYKKSHKVTADDSAYFWKKISKQCKEGTSAYSTAIGNMIAAETSWYDSNGKKKSSETYYSEIFSSAQTYLTNMETLNDWSMQEELNYWTAIQKQLKKGTQAWYDAQKQIKQLQDSMSTQDNDRLSSAQKTLNRIQSMNDMSIEAEIQYWQNIKSSMTAYSDAWWEVTQTIVSLKDSYNDEMYKAASDYADQMETLNSWSIQEELAYWQQVAKEVKKGSDAWYNAQSKINSIKSKIGTVSNMNSLLTAYTTYYDMSAKAEVDYWDTVRKQYAQGTDERLEADQYYYEAKKEYEEKLEDLEDDYLAKVEDVNKQLESDIKSLTDSYDNAIESRVNELKNAYKLFDEFTSSSVSGQELLFNLQTQAEGYEAWSDALDTLEERGILSDELLGELTEMGPEELAAIYALTDLTDEELQAYQDAFDRKMSAIQKQAEEENADLLDEVQQQTAELKATAQQELADLKAEYQSDVAAVNTNLSSEMKLLAQNTKSIAEDQTTTLVNAIKDGTDGVKAALSSSSSSAKSAASTASSVTSGAVSGSSSSSAKTDDILEAIYSGPRVTSLTASQRKKHNALYLYLVDNYDHGGNASSYTKLAKALGTTYTKGASSSTRKSQKATMLSMLKSKGYKAGGKVDDQDLIWMDEDLDEIGPEFVVSRRDNALLTRVPAGSEVIDANTTQNLIRLSKINPDELTAKAEEQQNAALSYLSNVGTANQVNDLVNTSIGSMMPDISTARMESLLDDMESIISEYLPYLANERGVYLDKDKLVGYMSDDISEDMAMRTRRRRA